MSEHENRTRAHFLNQYLKTGHAQVAENVAAAGLQPSDLVHFLPIPEGTVLTQEQFQQHIQKPALLMHAANFYNVQDSFSENDFTQDNLNSSKKHNKEAQGKLLKIRAIYENAALAAIYSDNGHYVSVILPQPNNRDGVYSVDSSQTVQKFTKNDDGTYTAGKIQTVTPTFMHKDRGNESIWKYFFFREALEDNTKAQAYWDVKKIRDPKEFGDTRFIQYRVSADQPGGFILVGIMEDTDTAHARSTIAGNNELGQKLGMPTVFVRLKKPFYHMDTAGVKRTDGYFFTNRECFADDASWNVMKKTFGDKLVEIPFADLENNFVGNGTCFGHNIYTCDRISDEAKKILTERGFNLYLTSIEAFIASGGGHRCNTAVLSQAHIENGYDIDLPDHVTQGKVFRVAIDFSKPIKDIAKNNAESPFSVYEQKLQPDGKYIEEKDPVRKVSALSLGFDNIEQYHIKEEEPQSLIKQISVKKIDRLKTILSNIFDFKSNKNETKFYKPEIYEALLPGIREKLNIQNVGLAAKEFVREDFIASLKQEVANSKSLTETSYKELVNKTLNHKTCIFSAITDDKGLNEMLSRDKETATTLLHAAWHEIDPAKAPKSISL